jgi:hypothetical protein
MAILQIARDCGGDCLLALNYAACASDCMVMETKMSTACSKCWGDFIDCATDKCWFFCGPDVNGTACKDCTVDNCDSAYHTCAGV